MPERTADQEDAPETAPDDAREGFHVVPSAPERHPELFALIRELRDLLSKWIDDPSTPRDGTPLNLVRAACCVRMWNMYKAIIPLLERDFWEDALILLRSAFELLLNVEEVFRADDEIERQKHALRFLMFSTLQEFLAWRAEFEYLISTGRSPGGENVLRKADEQARKAFGTFILSAKNGKVKWDTSWCRRNVFELAQASKHPIRVAHYRTLYAYCSQFVHATPMSVLSHLAFGAKADSLEWIEKRLSDDGHKIMFVTSILMTTVFELLHIAGDILPTFDRKDMFPIMEKWYALNGLKPPPKRDGGQTMGDWYRAHGMVPPPHFRTNKDSDHPTTDNG